MQYLCNFLPFFFLTLVLHRMSPVRLLCSVDTGCRVTCLSAWHPGLRFTKIPLYWCHVTMWWEISHWYNHCTFCAVDDFNCFNFWPYKTSNIKCQPNTLISKSLSSLQEQRSQEESQRRRIKESFEESESVGRKENNFCCSPNCHCRRRNHWKAYEREAKKEEKEESIIGRRSGTVCWLTLSILSTHKFWWLW